MKENLIIISDLWGKEKSAWLNNYTRKLKPKFDLRYYDSCELAQVDKSDYRQEALHQQFVNGGIEMAVENLIELEQNPVNVLAFSVGGTIAWKYGLRSKSLKSLYCVSSTRLRKETEKPEGLIRLFFGSEDKFKPQSEWLESMKLSYELIEGKGHQVYSEIEFAEWLCKLIFVD